MQHLVLTILQLELVFQLLVHLVLAIFQLLVRTSLGCNKITGSCKHISPVYQTWIADIYTYDYSLIDTNMVDVPIVTWFSGCWVVLGFLRDRVAREEGRTNPLVDPNR